MNRSFWWICTVRINVSLVKSSMWKHITNTEILKRVQTLITVYFKVHYFLHLFWKYLFWGSTFLTLLHLYMFPVLLICSCLGYFLYKRVQLNWANSWIMNSSLLIGRLCTVAVCACPCVMSLAWCEQSRITTGHVILSFSHIQQQLPHCGKHTHFHSESEV